MSGSYPTPTFQTEAILAGGSVAGTFSGNPVWSGNHIFQGTAALQGTTTVGTSAAAASLISNGPAAVARIMQWSTAGLARWRIQANATAESGSNVGSDLQMFGFSDAGASLGSQLLVTRSSGNWTWNNAASYSFPQYTFTNGSIIPKILNQGGTYTYTSGVAGGNSIQSPQPINQRIAIAGTIDAGLAQINTINIGDTVLGRNAPTNVCHFGVVANYNTGANGARQLMNLLINKTAASADGLDTFIQGLGVSVTGDAGESTNPASPLSRVNGLNIDCRVGGTGNAYRVLTCQENDIRVFTGNTVQAKTNISCHWGIGDAVHGTLEDSGINFGRSGTIPPGTGGGLTLMQMGGTSGNVWPLDESRSDTSIMQVQAPNGTGALTGGNPWKASAGFGFDLRGINFGTNAWRSLGFEVDGLGQLSAGPAKLTYISGGAQLAVPLFKAVSAVVHGGSAGSAYVVGDQIWDTTSGTLWSVATLSGSAIATVTLVKAGYYPSGNPTNVTVAGGSGTGAALDITTSATGTLTLGDTAQTVNIATGTLKVGASQMTANGSVATAMSSLGPAGSHTTIQEWLTVTNSAGTVRYIPCF